MAPVASAFTPPQPAPLTAPDARIATNSLKLSATRLNLPPRPELGIALMPEHTVAGFTGVNSWRLGVD